MSNKLWNCFSLSIKIRKLRKNFSRIFNTFFPSLVTIFTFLDSIFFYVQYRNDFFLSSKIEKVVKYLKETVTKVENLTKIIPEVLSVSFLIIKYDRKRKFISPLSFHIKPELSFKFKGCESFDWRFHLITWRKILHNKYLMRTFWPSFTMKSSKPNENKLQQLFHLHDYRQIEVVGNENVS